MSYQYYKQKKYFKHGTYQKHKQTIDNLPNGMVTYTYQLVMINVILPNVYEPKQYYAAK